MTISAAVAEVFSTSMSPLSESNDSDVVAVSASIPVADAKVTVDPVRFVPAPFTSVTAPLAEVTSTVPAVVIVLKATPAAPS